MSISIGGFMGWDGTLPRRRYAMFTDLLRGDYMVVVRGDDIERAPVWGGFIGWVGGVRRAESRDIQTDNAAICGP